jgi:hypothetical protein
MKIRPASLAAICCLSTTSAWITVSNQSTNRRNTRIFHSDSHFLPADVISRTGAPVSGITYSNYDSNPTAAGRSSSSDNNQSTTEPFTARGELIDPSASLQREAIISPPVPATPRVVPASTVTRGHPADEVGVRGWRQTISPPVSYPVNYQPAAAATSTAEPRELTPEQVAFQQAEMDRWTEAARLVEQKRLERLVEKEAFQKEELLRWDEAARRDAHWRSKKQLVDIKDTSIKQSTDTKDSANAKSSRRKKNNSPSSRKGRK